MAGYIGSKAVTLSTTAADVTGNAEIGGDLTVDTNTLYVDSTNNRVGIGTSSPSADGLHIYNATQPDLFMGTSADADGFRIVYNDTDTVLGNYSSTPLRISTGGSERMRIDSNGFVGIGTSSPSAALHLGGSSNQTIQIEGASNTAYYGTNGNRGDLFVNYDPTDGTILNSGRSVAGIQMDGADGGSNIRFRTAGANNAASTERMRIDSSGRVGVNTSSPEGKGVDVVHSRSDSYSETSDQRNLAHIIARNGSDASGRFSSISLISGGGTQAEGSINLVQKGNYVGDMTFKIRAGGGSTDWRERMKIDSAGRVTTPYQPAFWVRRSSDQSGYNGNDYTQSVVFDYKIYDTGNNFSTSTGLFTAPVTGVYLFWGAVYASSGSAISQIWITYNGGRNAGTDWTRSNNGEFINITAHVKLNAGDTVGLHPYGSIGNIIANEYHTWFKGILVG